MILENDADVGTNPLKCQEVDDPQPGPGQVRVQVQVCGVCRTDLHVVEGELPPFNHMEIDPCCSETQKKAGASDERDSNCGVRLRR